MIDKSKMLVERLRDIEEWARDCGWHNHASTACEAIAILEVDRAEIVESQLAPRISDAYTQGVKDAANKAKQHAHGYGQYRDHAQAKSACETLATEILALLPKELATEDMREKDEPTETQP
jgi:hypothetical protein